MGVKNHKGQGENGDTVVGAGSFDFDASPKAKLVFNKNATMRLLGISPEFIARLVRDGAPMVSGGNGSTEAWAIHLPSFVRFMIDDLKKSAKGGGDGKLSYDEAKRKDKEVQSSIRELELMKLQGEQCDVEDVRPFLREVLSTTRSRMLSVTSQVIGLTPNQQRDLQDAINDALTELSEGRVGEWNSSEEAQQLAHH